MKTFILGLLGLRGTASGASLVPRLLRQGDPANDQDQATVALLEAEARHRGTREGIARDFVVAPPSQKIQELKLGFLEPDVHFTLKARALLKHEPLPTTGWMSPAAIMTKLEVKHRSCWLGDLAAGGVQEQREQILAAYDLLSPAGQEMLRSELAQVSWGRPVLRLLPATTTQKPG